MRTTFVIIAALALVSISMRGAGTPGNRLEDSPRHQEWVAVKHGNRIVHSFLVFPEAAGKASAVVVIRSEERRVGKECRL